MTAADTYISRDDIRFSYLKEGEDYFSHETEAFNSFIQSIKRAINYNEYDNIFVDATHLNKKSRNKLLYSLGLDYIKKVKEINCIFLDTPLEVSLERNSKRTGRQYVPEATIIDMFKSISLPDETETNIFSTYIISYSTGMIERRIIERG